jgi:exopolyphosphatase/guanosine-5'-triphosphate,3'-diphosphate pyrophosphatase
MFLNRVRDETGIDVRVVDGHAEAVLTFQWPGGRYGSDGPVVVADIGGGSTELISAHATAMQAVRSPLRLGPVDGPFRSFRSAAPG